MNRVQDTQRDTTAQEQMIRHQIVERGVDDPAVIAAFRKVPREKFFAPRNQDSAYDDRATSIGHGQTISQPYMVALMTQRLAVLREHRVLEIGTGSGYQTAILSHVAKEVYTVERVKPLLDQAWERLMDFGCRNVHFKFADGTLGWPEHAPYDRILITAGAPSLPEKLLMEQLADGGIAVLPMGPQDEQMLVEVHRHRDKLRVVEICACRFVKLIGQQGWAE